MRRAPRTAAGHASAAALVLGALAGLTVSCATLPRPAGTAAPPVPTGRPPAPSAAGGEPPRPPSRTALRAEPVIDVGLSWDLESVSIDPEGEASVEVRAPVSLDLRERAESDAKLALGIRLEAGGAAVFSRGGSGWRMELRPGDTLWVTPRARPGSLPAPLLRWGERRWRGQFKVFLNPRGKLTLVDRLPLETYLLGVVPGEIGGLDEGLLEAGRAQAVAARSYTLFYLGRRAAEGFDLYATVEDQVYGAVESERPLATRCVESTRGLVALSGGLPIRANYCSTCGGITAEVWEAWPAAPLPYLVSHLDRGSGDYCAASRQYRWREEWSAGEFLLNLARFGPPQGVTLPPQGLGSLLDVRVEQRSRSGRVWRLVVSTTTGEVAIPAYAIRLVLRRGSNPDAILRSNLFKVDVRRDPASRRALAVVASGAGAGHGVGLCQTGALGMARQGADAATILAHYYRLIELRTLY